MYKKCPEAICLLFNLKELELVKSTLPPSNLGKNIMVTYLRQLNLVPNQLTAPPDLRNVHWKSSSSN